jgi:hypothetical protein
MKKKLIFILLLALAIQSYSKNIRIKAKSKIETESNFMGNKNLTSINYIPFQATIYTKPKEGKYLNFFFKFRGSRKNIKEANKTFYLIDSKPTTKIEEGKLTNLVDNMSKVEEYKETKYKNDIYSTIHNHYHGPHEHDYNITEDHEHDDDEHEHNHDTFATISKKYVRPIFTNDEDIQFKMGIEYLPNKFTKLKLTYMPLSYNGDDFKYRNSIIADTTYTKLFNHDKMSIVINPKLTTINGFTPYFIDFKTAFRYAKDENTTIGLELNNKLQTNVLNDYHNFKNSLNFTYDYNTEKKRFHKYWEILDHEHEKIDQSKIYLGITHTGTYTINSLKDAKLKYERKIDNIETKLNYTYKKTNFLIKNLIFETNFNLISNLGFTTLGKEYNITHELYSFSKTKNPSIENINNFGTTPSDMYDAWYYVQKEDTSSYFYNKFYIYNNMPYIIQEKGQATKPNAYKKSLIKINDFEFKNKTRVKYKNFDFKNSFYYYNNYILSNQSLDNEMKILYTQKYKSLTLIPSYKHEFDAFFTKQGKHYHYNLFTLGLDINNEFIFDDLSFKLGFDISNEFQIRKATKLGIHKVEGNINEADKNIYGNIIRVIPYLNIKYIFNNNLNMKANIKFNYNKYHDVTRGNNYTMYSPRNFKEMILKTKLIVNYEW